MPPAPPRGIGGTLPGGQVVNPAGVIDGITVGGDDGNTEGGGFDQRIRVGGGNGEMGMLETM